MKIYSNFQDYYDGVQGMGMDTSVVFDRKYGKISLQPPFTMSLSFWSREKGDVRVYSEDAYWRLNNRDGHDEGTIFIFFAGKLYPLLRVYICKDGHQEEKIVSSFDEYVAYLDSFGFKPFNTTYRLNDSIKELENYFKFSPDSVASWMIDNKLVIAKADYKDLKNGLLRINPCLKDYKFQRILDPYMAYQEISMWVGGILPQSKEVQDVPDKYKIEQHGFDPQWSFRKHKLDNK